MRPLFSLRALGATLAFLCGMQGHAQPKEITFTLVRDGHGRPLRSDRVEGPSQVALDPKRRATSYWVEQRFLISSDYPYAPSQAGNPKSWTLTGSRTAGRGRRRLQFTVLVDCWCDALQVVVVCGKECMRLELPNDPDERASLLQRYGTDEGTGPPAILFRSGTYAFSEAIIQPSTKHKRPGQRDAPRSLR